MLTQITRHSNKILKGKIIDVLKLVFSTTFNNSTTKKKKERERESLSKKTGLGMQSKCRTQKRKI